MLRVSVVKREKKRLLLYSETLFKKTVYYRDLQANFQDMLRNALSMPRQDLNSEDMLRKLLDSNLMDIHLKKKADGKKKM